MVAASSVDDGENVTVVQIGSAAIQNDCSQHHNTNQHQTINQHQAINQHHNISHERQETLQIVDVDLELFLKNQGCVIQRTFIDIAVGSDYSIKVIDMSHDEEHFGNGNTDVPIECEPNHRDILSTSNEFASISTDDNKQYINHVTVNKGFIVDQNVGVSGEVLMVTRCCSLESTKARCISKSESKSMKISTQPSVVYIGTIEESTVNHLVNTEDAIQIVERSESGRNGITLSFYDSATQTLDGKRSLVDNLTQSANDETNSIKSSVEYSPSSGGPPLLLQWRVLPVEGGLGQEYVNASPTPSSMFSCAYTVTELGSDNSSDAPPSEFSNSTISSRRTSEVDDGIGKPSDDGVLRFHDYLLILQQINAFNNAYQFNEVSNIPDQNLLETNTFDRNDREGSNRSIVFSYIPSRDQREKEDEELWVTNEATYSNLNEESGNCEILTHSCKTVTELNCLPVIVEKAATNLKACQANYENASNKTSGAKCMRICLPVNECPAANGAYKTETIGGSWEHESELSSVLTKKLCSEGVCNMAAAVCSVNPSERRHFSARQRLVGDETINELSALHIKEANGTMTTVKNIINANTCSVTSSATNQPTKRFSFLIRNNSMDQHDITMINSSSLNTLASASDKAILEGLAELKLDDAKENINIKKRVVNSSMYPPCRRCQEPVYPKERLQPSKDILFHIPCFKCYQCGVQLNLKTFYRNPINLRDFRIFCKSHVPALDPGRVTQSKTGQADRAAERTAGQAGSYVQAAFRGNSDVHYCHNQTYASSGTLPLLERVVVKGDTQGLRYF